MTGLIYVVIIALWAAVLIPIWLRRHDQISEVRSTARFSSAMRSLGSPGNVQYASDAAVDAHLMEAQVTDVTAYRGRPSNGEARMARPTYDRPTTDARPGEGLDPDYERELVRQSAATRRAIILGSLTAVLALCLLLAVVGVLPKWVPALAALPVVAFVVAASMTASQRSASRPASRRTRPARPVRETRPEPKMPPMSAAVEDDWETWNAWDDDEDAWEPVPATLPTYVSAPRASAVPRGIDRAHDGDWSGEAMVETAQAMRSRPRSEPLMSPPAVDHSATTAEIPVVGRDYDERRAVNG